MRQRSSSASLPSTPRCGPQRRHPADGSRCTGGVGVLGILSHAVFIPIQFACICFSVFDVWRRSTSWSKRLSHVVEWQLAPGAALLTYYLLFLQTIAIGGGPEYSLYLHFRRDRRVSSGDADRIGRSVVVSRCLVASRFWLSCWLPDQRRPLLFVSALVLLGAPIAGVLNPSRLFYPRYLSLSLSRCSRFCSDNLLARGFNAGRRTAVAAFVVLLLLGVGGAFHAVSLAQVGRGQYLERPPSDSQ